MNILVISQFIPMPDRQADMLRLMEMLRIAATRHSVSLLATDVSRQVRIYGEEIVATSIQELGQNRIRFCQEGEAVARHAQYDVLLFEYYPLARSRLERMRYRFPRAVMVIDTVDINYLRLASQERAAGASAPISREVKAIRDAELQTYSTADVVIAICNDEQRRLQVDLPAQNVHVVPLIIDAPARRTARASSARLLFVGNFNHEANVDGARFMIDQILPIVRRSIPEACLMIVGNRPPPSLVSDPCQGVEVTGFVPDLAPYYEMCDIGIAPLTWGGGLKGKVAEAMANGLPVVTTSVGASGFGLRHRTHAMVADTASDFAAAIIEVHADRHLYDRLSAEGRSFVELNFSRANVAKSIDELFAWTARIAPAGLPRSRRVQLALKIAFHRHVGWRREQKAATRRLTIE